jgi:transposase
VITTVWRQYQTTGTIEPKGYKGRVSTIGAEMEELIRQTIRETPGRNLLDLIEKLRLPIRESGLSRRLKKMGLTYKKDAPSKRAKARRCLFVQEENGKSSNPS